MYLPKIIKSHSLNTIKKMSFVFASTEIRARNILYRVGQFNKWDKLNNEKRKKLMSVLKEGMAPKILAETYIDLDEEFECYKAGFALSWNCVWEGYEDDEVKAERMMKAKLRKAMEKCIVSGRWMLIK